MSTHAEAGGRPIARRKAGSLMPTFLLAWRQFKSHWASGEIRVLLFALILAVAATTAVGFFTDRIESALERQGGLLLGGDLVVADRHELPQAYVAVADQERKGTGLNSKHE